MYKWLARVGIESIKEAIVDDDERRKELYDGICTVTVFFTAQSMGRKSQRRGRTRIQTACRTRPSRARVNVNRQVALNRNRRGYT